MKLVAIDKNLKAQKNTPDHVIKKAKALLNAFLNKDVAPKKLKDGYGYAFRANLDWRVYSQDLKAWVIVEHHKFNELSGVRGCHK